MRSLLPAAALLAVACAFGGAEARPDGKPPVSEAKKPEPVLTGDVTRADVLALPSWRVAFDASRVDEGAARALATVPAGAEVLVVLGTWCGDSRREVARLWRALDAAGEVPFSLRLIAVGRDKRVPDEKLGDLDIRFVPTLIVRREGREVGRVVASAPEGIEKALGDLLTGRRTGVISGRDDLDGP